MIHFLLNTFVLGLKPISEAEKATLNRRSSVAQQTAICDAYLYKPNDEENYFTFFGKKITGADLNWLSFVRSGEIQQDDDDEDDLILHDPKFWQLPSIWWPYFKRQNGNSSSRAFVAYTKAMIWKIKSLGRLTLGIWSESQIEQFQIRYRASIMNINLEEQEEHEAMMKTVGQRQSIVWLFVPYFWARIFAKAGEAFNQVPLFVYDLSCETALSKAQSNYEKFLEAAGVKEEVTQAEVDLWRAEQESVGIIKPEENAPTVEKDSDDSGTVEKRYKDYGALPPGWFAVKSRSRPGETSYENSKTGEVSHRHPLDPIYLARLNESERENEKLEAGKIKTEEGNRFERMIPTPGPGSWPRREDTSVAKERELPPDWQAVPSRSRPGLFSYKNVKTKEVIRMHPSDIPKWKEDKKKERDEERQKIEMNRLIGDARDADNAPYANRTVGNRQIASIDEDRRALPPGWKAVPSRSRPGQISYLNDKTREIFQTHPLDIPKLVEQWEKEREDLSMGNQVNRATLAAPSVSGRERGPSVEETRYTMTAPMRDEQTAVSSNRTTARTINTRRDDLSVTFGVNTTAKTIPTRSTRGDQRSAISGNTAASRRSKRMPKMNESSAAASKDDDVVRPVERVAPRRRMIREEADVTKVDDDDDDDDDALVNGGAPPSQLLDEEEDCPDSMPIKLWLKEIEFNPGSYGRLTNDFFTQGVRNVGGLRKLDDADFIFLRKRIKQKLSGEKRNLAHILNEMLIARESVGNDNGTKPHAATTGVVSPRVHFGNRGGGDENGGDNDNNDGGSDDDDEEVDENEGSNQNPRKDDNEDDTDRGMHVLTFNAEKEQLAKANLSFHETRRCWIIEVQRPYDEKVTVGEGMLVWFDSYSTIGSTGDAADESCASVRFMEYNKDEHESQQYQHAEQISERQAYFMFDFNPLFKLAQFGIAYAGSPGENLPSRSKPLFVPKRRSESGRDHFCCVLWLDCPRGTTPSFTLRACYISAPPLTCLEPNWFRRAQWFCYVMLLAATNVIVFSEGVYQIAGIYLFLLAAISGSTLGCVDTYVSWFYT